jgi:FkbM family methyltransferase
MQFIPEQAVILDIGANIGNHSVFWATSGGARQIIAFEPVVETYRMLRRNIEINGLEKTITAYNIALGDKKSLGEIADLCPHNIGGTSIRVGNGMIKIDALDNMNLAIDKYKIDFVKIDVEGFELHVLRGIIGTITKYKPIIFLEAFEKNFADVKKFLLSMGYDEPVIFPDSNYLFQPKSGMPAANEINS